ncbi:Trans-1,2-dihydrobenzene-1,2-diol dehydrogenase [Porphyridium purpureum]|uniref:D-xylose 1-dehydrogenase (NADP(+), D-xylono-1,5-lactone-forming) n=1 Tax=Porphyridium purpureum TaxID=35688 RepID=A0A5J4Z1W6_PORPP|nr:Trans-1,2-dihydrobenzene-1,2-diol dehydrogenase [Porphyridium purpureum]|eukprot:POR1693..scf295_1
MTGGGQPVEAALAPVPLDIASKLTLPLEEYEKQHPAGAQVRWGIVGAGRVCHDFVQALKVLPCARVVAVAAREGARAEKFAQRHGIARWYEGYQQLVEDPDVQIVYVGTVQSEHLVHATMALQAGKHVLVEKPAGLDATQVRTMVQLARAKKLFFLEGMWTRFFPAVEHARHLIFERKEIGEVSQVMSDFGFNSFEQEKYPESPMYDPQLGGGALLYVGVYPLAAVSWAFRGKAPDQLVGVGHYDMQLSVDMSGSLALRYGRHGASVSYGLMCESAEETSVVGTEGRLIIHTPAHCPLSITVSSKKNGRGNVVHNQLSFALPQSTPEIAEAGGFNYPNSIGFAYEAAAVMRCLLSGLLECPQYPPEESIVVAEMMDAARVQVQCSAKGT